jgi:hypothetical protein
MDLKKLIKEVLENHKIDCGCGCNNGCAKAPILNENLQVRVLMTDNMKYHIDNNKPLTETALPYGSKEYLDLWVEARYLYSRGAINAYGIDKEKITETHLGEYGIFEGQIVPLDLPLIETLNEMPLESKALYTKDQFIRMVKMYSDMGKSQMAKELEDELLSYFDTNESIPARLVSKILIGYGYPLPKEINEAEYQGRKVTLNKPSQGDSKKFKVYVKNAKGKVVKVNFGFGGKSAKGKRMVIKDKNPKARAAYRARHNCKNPGPKWKANYWSCKAW